MNKLIISTNEEEVRLTGPQGEFIKALIYKLKKLSQTDYADSIGMNKGLLSRYLSGDMRLTPDALNKILSNLNFVEDGIQYQYDAAWRIIIEIRPLKIGPIVRDVDSTDTDEMLLSEDSG